MEGMTDKQMQFIAWLITTATDKCHRPNCIKSITWKPSKLQGTVSFFDYLNIFFSYTIPLFT